MLEKIERIIKNSTSHQQKVVAIEEFSELIKEITKDLRYKNCNILEEYCDCLIMLEQLKIIYNLKDEEIEEMCNKKIKRTFERLEIEE